MSHSSTVRPVTPAQAHAVRDAVIEHFRSWTRGPDGVWLDEPGLPVLHEPNTGWGDQWCLVWIGYHEPTPYLWPTLCANGGTAEFTRATVAPLVCPPGVACEAASVSELTIHRA
jgi:hypothetical protein